MDRKEIIKIVRKRLEGNELKEKGEKLVREAQEKGLGEIQFRVVKGEATVVAWICDEVFEFDAKEIFPLNKI